MEALLQFSNCEDTFIYVPFHERKLHMQPREDSKLYALSEPFWPVKIAFWTSMYLFSFLGTISMQDIVVSDNIYIYIYIK